MTTNRLRAAFFYLCSLESCIKRHSSASSANYALIRHDLDAPDAKRVCNKAVVMLAGRILVCCSAEICSCAPSILAATTKKQIPYIVVFHSFARYLKYLACLTTSGAHSIAPTLRRKISAHETAAWLLRTCCRISNALRYSPTSLR